MQPDCRSSLRHSLTPRRYTLMTAVIQDSMTAVIQNSMTAVIQNSMTAVIQNSMTAVIQNSMSSSSIVSGSFWAAANHSCISGHDMICWQ
jgi:hypothetical protein